MDLERVFESGNWRRFNSTALHCAGVQALAAFGASKMLRALRLYSSKVAIDCQVQSGDVELIFVS
jgi:hypothetical protein